MVYRKRRKGSSYLRRRLAGGQRKLRTTGYISFTNDVPPDTLNVKVTDKAEFVDFPLVAEDHAIYNFLHWNSMSDASQYIGTAARMLGWARVADSYIKYQVRSAVIRMTCRLKNNAANYAAITGGFYVWMYAHPSGSAHATSKATWAGTAAAPEDAEIGGKDRTNQIMLMKADPRCSWIYFPPTAANTERKTTVKSMVLKTRLAYQQRALLPAQVAIATTFQANVNTPPASPADVSLNLLVQHGVMMDDTEGSVPAIERSYRIEKYVHLFNRELLLTS